MCIVGFLLVGLDAHDLCASNCPDNAMQSVWPAHEVAVHFIKQVSICIVVRTSLDRGFVDLDVLYTIVGCQSLLHYMPTKLSSSGSNASWPCTCGVPVLLAS